MAIPTVQEFRTSTAPLVKKIGLIKITKGYGTNMSKVLAALEVYWAHVQAEELIRVRVLYILWKECDKWLRLKEGKNTNSSELFYRRKLAVANLQQEVLVQLAGIDPRLTSAFIGYQTRKQEGKYNNLTTLKQGYTFERQFYLKQGKLLGSTVSGSYVGEQLIPNVGDQDLRHQSFIDLGGRKNSHQINLKDVERLVRSGAIQFGGPTGGNVTYFNKIERLRYLLTIDRDGLFHDISDEVVHMNDLSFGAFRMAPYAMDAYGHVYMVRNHMRRQNVVSFNSGTGRYGLGNGSWFNHSSYLAGREVLCAGCLHIGYDNQRGVEAPGVLSAIDNCSGHYKPNRAALTRCLQVLQGEGVNVSRARVADYSAGLENVRIYWGENFLNGGQAWVDTEQPGDGLPAPPVAFGTGRA